MATTRFRKPPHIALADQSNFSGSSPYQQSAIDYDEYESQGLNLGVESIAASPLPSPMISRENSWLKTGDPFALALAAETAGSSSSSYSLPQPPCSPRTVARHRATSSVSSTTAPPIVPGGRPLRGKRETVWDKDCAICFESAVQPHRTLCCGTLFCLDHISDWMERDSHCPTCRVEMVPSTDRPEESDESLASSSDESTQTEVPHYDSAWARILKRPSSSRTASQRRAITIETIMESEDALLLMRLAFLLLMGMVYWVLLA